MSDTVSRPKATPDSLKLKMLPLPQSALRAAEMVNNPEGPSVREVSSLAEQDPMVAARLLRIVNSALFNPSTRISDIRRATVALGPSNVAQLVLAMHFAAVSHGMDSRSIRTFLKIVRHSIATAYMARYIVQTDPIFAKKSDELPQRLAEAYTAGLMHDFGKLVLIFNFGKDASSFYDNDALELDAAQALKAERERFGFDHVEAGVFVVGRLAFPQRIVTALSAHHMDFRLPSETPYIERVLAAADRAVTAQGFALHAATDWNELRECSSWADIQGGDSGYYSGESLVYWIEKGAEAVHEYVNAFM